MQLDERGLRADFARMRVQKESILVAPLALLRLFTCWASLHLQWNLLQVKFDVEKKEATPLTVLIDALLWTEATRPTIAVARDAVFVCFKLCLLDCADASDSGG